MSVPTTVRLPFFWGTVEEGGSTRGSASQTIELVGLATSNTGARRLLSSADHAATLFGAGSVLHRMAIRAFEAAPANLIYGTSVAAAEASTPAAWTATVTVTTAAAGTIRLWVGSEYVDIPVSAGQAQNSIASAIAAAFPSVSSYPVSGGVLTNVATLTFRHGGTAGNDLRIALDRSMALPSGVSVVVAQSVTGATDPTLTAAIALMAAAAPRKIALWTDKLDAAIGAEMDLRWDWTRQQMGFAFVATRMTAGEGDPTGYTAELAAMISEALPYRHLASVKVPFSCRAPAYEIAASIAATCARYDEAYPGLTVRGRTLLGCRGADSDEDLSPMQRDQLLRYGGTTCGQSGGYLVIDRCRTTRYQSESGVRDERSANAAKMWLVEWAMYDLRATMSLEYPQARLLPIETGYAPAQCATLGMIRGSFVGWYRKLCDLGYASGPETFAEALTVTIPEDDPDRVDARLPAALADSFEILAPVLVYE